MNKDEVRALLERVQALTAEEGPEDEPYKQQYEAADLLARQLAELSGKPHDAVDAAILLARRGTVLLETDLLAEGEQCLRTALLVLVPRLLEEEQTTELGVSTPDSPSRAAELLVLLQESYNALGGLWCSRSDWTVSLQWLGKAEALYNSRPGHTSQIVMDPLFTTTCFFLAQVHGLSGNREKSAAYCGATLERQLATGQFQLSDMVQNCCQMAGFYSPIAFASAARCLHIADAVTSGHLGRKCTPSATPETPSATPSATPQVLHEPICERTGNTNDSPVLEGVLLSQNPEASPAGPALEASFVFPVPTASPVSHVPQDSSGSTVPEVPSVSPVPRASAANTDAPSASEVSAAIAGFPPVPDASAANTDLSPVTEASAANADTPPDAEVSVATAVPEVSSSPVSHAPEASPVSHAPEASPGVSEVSPVSHVLEASPVSCAPEASPVSHAPKASPGVLEISPVSHVPEALPVSTFPAASPVSPDLVPSMVVELPVAESSLPTVIPQQQTLDSDVAANLSLAWAKLYLQRLSSSHMSSDTDDEDASVPKASPADPIPMPSLVLPCPVAEPPRATDFESALLLFNTGMAYYEKALRYYLLDGWVVEHVGILLEMANMYRLLADFQEDPVKCSALHKQRAAQLDHVSGDALNAEHYPDLCRAIEVEVGNAWRDVLEALAEDGSEPAKITAASRASVQHYGRFLNSFKQPDGSFPARIDQEYEAHYLRASFSLGRMLYRCGGTGSHSSDQEHMLAGVQQLKTACGYVNKHNLDNFRQEAELGAQLADLVEERAKLTQKLAGLDQ